MRLLEALASTSVPHARLVAAEPSEHVIGSAFYLMKPVLGVNPAVTVPARLQTSTKAQDDFGVQVVTALTQLSALDPVAIGLQDLGRPDGFLQRQPGRWLDELRGYEQDPRYRGGSLPHTEEIARWLAERVPQQWTPGILHGDFHVGNVMVDDGGQVLAIVDWEMTTVGDPLLDLGWLLATWPAPGREDLLQSAIGELPGLTSPTELVEHYARLSSRDLSCLDWYVVLACFKLAVVIEGTYARSLAGRASVETGESLHRRAIALLERAMEQIHQS